MRFYELPGDCEEGGPPTTREEHHAGPLDSSAGAGSLTFSCLTHIMGTMRKIQLPVASRGGVRETRANIFHISFAVLRRQGLCLKFANAYLPAQARHLPRAGWKSRQEAALRIHPDTEMPKVRDKLPSRWQLSPTRAWEGVENCQRSCRQSAASLEGQPGRQRLTTPPGRTSSSHTGSTVKEMAIGQRWARGPIPRIPLLRILVLCPPALSLSDQSCGVLKALLPRGPLAQWTSPGLGHGAGFPTGESDETD